MFADSGGSEEVGEKTLVCTGHKYHQTLPPCVPSVNRGDGNISILNIINSFVPRN